MMKEVIQSVATGLKVIGWNGGLLLLALVLIFTIIALLIFSRREETVVQESIHLSDLSKLWTMKDGEEIHISELYPIWRDQPSLSRDAVTIEFRNPRVQAFMDKKIENAWFKKFPQQKAVCLQLLKLLDQEGQCPSVVDLRGDVEAGWDENTYQILAKTNLLAPVSLQRVERRAFQTSRVRRRSKMRSPTLGPDKTGG